VVKDVRRELRELREKHRQEITAFRKHQLDKEAILEDKLVELLKAIPKKESRKRIRGRYPIARFEVGDLFSGDRYGEYNWRVTRVEGTTYYIQYDRPDGVGPLTTTLTVDDGYTYTYYYKGKHATT